MKMRPSLRLCLALVILMVLGAMLSPRSNASADTSPIVEAGLPECAEDVIRLPGGEETSITIVIVPVFSPTDPNQLDSVARTTLIQQALVTCGLAGASIDGPHATSGDSSLLAKPLASIAVAQKESLLPSATGCTVRAAPQGNGSMAVERSQALAIDPPLSLAARGPSLRANGGLVRFAPTFRDVYALGCRAGEVGIVEGVVNPGFGYFRFYYRYYIDGQTYIADSSTYGCSSQSSYCVFQASYNNSRNSLVSVRSAAIYWTASADITVGFCQP